jgi:ubiquinone/menaquinone biosynthesis C-methylase UbiE
MWRGAWIKQYIAMLERDERESFQQPARVMETLSFKPGERVADVGAGSGYFTVLVARAVEPDGTVLATDIRQEMLDYLGERLQEEDIQNVELKLVPKDDPQLPAGGVDTILMVDVWHYIRDPEFAKKLAAGLAPGGRLVVIDYRPKPWEERPWGPPPVQQTPREEVDAHMAEAGLKPVRVHDFLSEQYFVEYQK